MCGSKTLSYHSRIQDKPLLLYNNNTRNVYAPKDLAPRTIGSPFVLLQSSLFCFPGNSHKGSFMNLEGGKHVLRLKQVIDPVYPVKKECVPPEYFILST